MVAASEGRASIIDNGIILIIIHLFVKGKRGDHATEPKANIRHLVYAIVFEIEFSEPNRGCARRTTDSECYFEFIGDFRA